jgi:hypothetical protein
MMLITDRSTDEIKASMASIFFLPNLSIIDVVCKMMHQQVKKCGLFRDLQERTASPHVGVWRDGDGTEMYAHLPSGGRGNAKATGLSTALSRR